MVELILGGREMIKKRNTHTAEFKAKVALEAVRGVQTVNEWAQHYGVHPVQVGQWKKALIELVAQDAVLKIWVVKAEGFMWMVAQDKLSRFKKRLQEFGYLLV